MKSDGEWISISDMMSGLMMVFLFIAISFMIEVERDKKRIEDEREKVKGIAKEYKNSQKSLYIDLNREFKDDLKRWGAEITEDNIFRFKSPEVLFEVGSSNISERFKEILDDFFPRYIKILTSKRYRDEIDEVRIEGHTSNTWKNSKSKQEIYLNNMRLSQKRANNVLSYCYQINNYMIDINRDWLEKNLRANGMAFAKLIYKEDGEIDLSKSRRVEFKVVTKAQEKIYKILEKLKGE